MAKSYQLEKNTNFSAIDKDYIKSLVGEKTATLEVDVKSILTELKAMISALGQTCPCTSAVDDLVKRMNYLEQRYKEDDKFTLTKAKMINFMAQQEFK